MRDPIWAPLARAIRHNSKFPKQMPAGTVALLWDGLKECWRRRVVGDPPAIGQPCALSMSTGLLLDLERPATAGVLLQMVVDARGGMANRGIDDIADYSDLLMPAPLGVLVAVSLAGLWANPTPRGSPWLESALGWYDVDAGSIGGDQ